MILRVLFDGLWQGVPIVAIAALVNRFVAQRNAVTRYAVWFATLLALVAVPVVAVLSNAGALLLDAVRPHAPAGTWTISLLPAQALAHGASGFVAPVLPWIMVAWLAGVAICLARLAASLTRICRIRKNATPSYRGAGDVFVSAEVTIPIAVGLRTPAIIIPKQLFETLSAADLERVVAHERAHVRRHDVAGNLVQRLVEAILFFNPCVHFAGRNLVLEREAACDDWAVRKTGDPGEYAAFLATLAGRICQPHAPHTPLATPSALGSRRNLLERIERLGGSPARRLDVNYYAIGGTVMIFVLLTLALEALSPALAFAPAQPISTAASNATAQLAAACAKPNLEATVISPAEPHLPHGLVAKGSAIVAVTLAPNGNVSHVSISKSSGNAQIDRAVLVAAAHSTYSPKLVDCTAVTGSYLFRADFKPDGQ